MSKPERVARVGVFLAILGLTALGIASCAYPTTVAWSAFPRLALACALVLVLPGWFLLRQLNPFPSAADVIERTVLACGVGYAFLTVVAIAVPLLHWNILSATALVLCLAPILSLLMIVRRSATPSPELDTMLPGPVPVAEGRVPIGLLSLTLVLLAAVLFFAWTVEPPIMGEEVVELITVRKLLANHQITLNNVLHRPDTLPTYIFTPYYLFVALIAKVSGLPFIAAYVKLRTLHVLLALAAFWSLGCRLLCSRFRATLALCALLMLLLIDPDPWSWPASFLPLCRRGSFAAGFLLPTLMLASLHAVFAARGGPFVPVAVASLLLLSLLLTHALEAMFFLFFLVAVCFTGLCWDRRRRALLTGLALVGTILVFRTVHASVVDHIAAYENERKAPLWAELHSLLAAPTLDRLFRVPEAGKYLLSTAGGVAVYAIFPLLLLPLLRLRQCAAHLLLWTAVALPLLLYSTPCLLLFQLAATPEVNMAAAYFAVLGLLLFFEVVFSLAARLAHLARPERWIRPAFLVLACVGGWVIGQWVLLPCCWWAVDLVGHWPGMPLLAALTAGILAFRGRASGDPDLPPPRPVWGLAAFVLCALLPLFLGMKQFPGTIAGSNRANVPEQVWASREVPSVFQWEAYYPLFQQRSNPPIDLPWPVVKDLRRVLPPGRVLIYDPCHSYTLPVLLDEYIVNPGHLLSYDLRYFAVYVHPDGTGGSIHPIFNSSDELTDEERQFLREYGVEYILVNPVHCDVVGRKLSKYEDCFRLIYHKDGYHLYRIDKVPAEARREESLDSSIHLAPE